MRRGGYQLAGLVPLPCRWWRPVRLLAVLLAWGSHYFDWVALRAHSGQRVLLLLGLMVAGCRGVFRCPVGGRAQAAADAAPLSVLCTRRSGGNTG